MDKHLSRTVVNKEHFGKDIIATEYKTFPFLEAFLKGFHVVDLLYLQRARLSILFQGVRVILQSFQSIYSGQAHVGSSHGSSENNIHQQW